MKYKIGEILVSTKDTTVQMALSNETKVIPKGNEVIVGADGLAHHLRTDMIQPFKKGTEIEGYDTNGLTEYLYRCLSQHFPLKEMLKEHDYDSSFFRVVIQAALEDIGF